MKSVFVKKPFQFDVREIPIPPLGPHDVQVRVKACGLCGTDVRQAAIGESFAPFGHEVAGIVEAIGSAVENVRPGDDVCLESGTFDRFSDLSRNGKVDLDMTGRSMFNDGIETMGFAEHMVVPCECCVKFSGLTYAQASLIEPLGVAYDLWKVTGVELGEDVLVYGLGPIGLFALRLARLNGARRIYAVNRSGRDARDALALAWGADAVIHPDETPLTREMFEKGGVDKVFMTASPAVMPDTMALMNTGGVMGFIGIGSDELGDRRIAFDMRFFHDQKLQIRASNAVPALYFPACLALCNAGMIDMQAMISHKIRLDHFAADVRAYLDDRKDALKAVMEL